MKQEYGVSPRVGFAALGGSLYVVSPAMFGVYGWLGWACLVGGIVMTAAAILVKG